MIFIRFMQHIKEQNWFAVGKIQKNKIVILLTIPFLLMGCQTMEQASGKAFAAVVVLPVMAIAGMASAISNAIGDDCKSDCQNSLMTTSKNRQSKYLEAKELTYQQCSEYIQTNTESNLCNKENFKICVNGVAEELYKNNTISIFQKHNLIDETESYLCDELTILDSTDNLVNKKALST